jgi:hypothetical protein
VIGLRCHLRFGAGRLDVFLIGLAHAGAYARLNPAISEFSRSSTDTGDQSITLPEESLGLLGTCITALQPWRSIAFTTKVRDDRNVSPVESLDPNG